MRPGILHELSQRLAILLEQGLRGSRDDPQIPVLLCHPLDAFQGREDLEGGTLAVLYPTRVAPQREWHRAGLSLDRPAAAGGGALDLKERLRFPALWVRVRYVFLAAGGGIEDQLGAIAAALRTLHDNPTVLLQAVPEPGVSPQGGAAPSGRGREANDTPQLMEEEARQRKLEEGTFPLSLLEDAEGWRELGLPEHALTIAFEVTVPIPSGRTETLPRVIERELQVEEGSQ